MRRPTKPGRNSLPKRLKRSTSNPGRSGMVSPCARPTRYRASEPLDPGAQLDFPGPGAAVLSVYVQVVLRDLVGEEHPVRAALARPRVARAPRDPAVDDEVRDVDALGRELPRHALREAAQRELPHRERRRFGVALHARRGAGEENRPCAWPRGI